MGDACKLANGTPYHQYRTMTYDTTRLYGFVRRIVCLLAGLLTARAATAQRGGNTAGADSVKAHYRKLEVRIPMRDGVKLFTSVYIPRDTASAAPIIMDRTPYGVAPYGPEAYRPSLG